MSINYRGLDWNASPYFSDMEAAELENNKLREALRECVTHIEDLRGTILNEFSHEQWDSTPQLELILKEFWCR